jgi:hypothetical protein
VPSNCFEIADQATCAVCMDLTESIAVIEEATEALETGTWTMGTIARARRFLRRTRHYAQA